MRKLISILALSLAGSAAMSMEGIDTLSIHRALLPSFTTGIINWKVGQEMNHNIAVMGMSGTMATKVASETNVGYWLSVDISISGMNQKIESLISKTDGTVLEQKVNGQKQTPQQPPEMEVEEMKETNISVPAGKFDCTYAKLKDLKTNEVSEMWLNLKLIPINGMLKIKASQRGMELTGELTSFKM